MIFWWLISILRITFKIFKHKIEQQQHAICQNEFIIIKLIVDNFFFGGGCLTRD